jgi:hypothetical protein
MEQLIINAANKAIQLLIVIFFLRRSMDSDKTDGGPKRLGA